jgi:hypothetical protein
MIPEEESEQRKKEYEELRDVYHPIFDDKKKKFKYKKDPKKAKYAECPTCAIRIYHEQAEEVVKCNSCGFAKPSTKKKTKYLIVKSVCHICRKKRKCQKYVDIKSGKNKAYNICAKCFKGNE